MNEPLPCPFCKSEDVKQVFGNRNSYVICRNCNAKGPASYGVDFISQRAAVEYWNRAPREAE